MGSSSVVVIIFGLLLFVGIGTHHSFVVGSRGPSMILLLFLVQKNLSFQNVQTQSSSQSTGIDSRFRLMPGSTCAFLAFRGSISSGSSVVFVDSMELLFAHRTLIGSCSISFPGQLSVKKCPVAAESGLELTCGVTVTAIANVFLFLFAIFATAAYVTFFLTILGEGLLCAINLVLLMLFVSLNFLPVSSFSQRLQLL